MSSRIQNMRRRGMTLIESMIAMAVLLIGASGILSAQVMVVRNNQMGKRMAQASALTTDFRENVQLWSYDDPRLEPLATVIATDAAAVKNKWEMWTGTDTPAYTAQYSDLAGDSF